MIVIAPMQSPQTFHHRPYSLSPCAQYVCVTWHTCQLAMHAEKLFLLYVITNKLSRD